MFLDVNMIYSVFFFFMRHWYLHDHFRHIFRDYHPSKKQFYRAQTWLDIFLPLLLCNIESVQPTLMRTNKVLIHSTRAVIVDNERLLSIRNPLKNHLNYGFSKTCKINKRNVYELETLIAQIHSFILIYLIYLL